MTYTKKTLDEIKANIVLNLMNNVDEINDANIGSIVDMIVTSLSQELEEQYDDLDVVYQGTRISTATGDDLEEIGAVVGVDRNEGSEATGYVTFIRNSPASAQFTITQGSIVSTQPNTETTQYKFTVDSDTLFKTSISGEEHLFVNGVNINKLHANSWFGY